MNMRSIGIIIVASIVLLSIFTTSVGARCSTCISTKSACRAKNFEFVNYFWKLVRIIVQFEVQTELSSYEKDVYQKPYHKTRVENEYAVRYEEYYYPTIIYPSCAVIIGGGTGSSNFPEISYYAHKIYLGLKKKGFSDENIYYISAERKTGVDAFSNKDNARYALKYWLRAHSGPMTNCYIFLLGHGNHRKDEGLLLLGQGYIGESDVAKWIDGISYKKCIIMIGCCAANYFKDGLSGKNREILIPPNYYATTHDIAVLTDKALSKVEINRDHKKLPPHPIPFPYKHIKPHKLLKIKII